MWLPLMCRYRPEIITFTWRQFHVENVIDFTSACSGINHCWDGVNRRAATRRTVSVTWLNAPLAVDGCNIWQCRLQITRYLNELHMLHIWQEKKKTKKTHLYSGYNAVWQWNRERITLGLWTEGQRFKSLQDPCFREKGNVWYQH